MNTVICCDCLDGMAMLADSSVDAIITDPPYGLGFMGAHWDHSVPGVDYWREALRILKPGGHLLAFAGTRTQHRMACAIEDAGFEVRDLIAWVYGSGFPKSHNLGGDWQGWGTALKPALEPITVARKPFPGTVAANVLAHGVGAVNIDGCRVEGVKPLMRAIDSEARNNPILQTRSATGTGETTTVGRWPANLIHDGSPEVVGLFPDSNGAGGSLPQAKITGYGDGIGNGKSEYFGGPRIPFDSGTGSAARFFYCAKAGTKDRDEGLEGFAPKNNMRVNGPREDEATKTATLRANHHPTVKPTELMRYLCRLVTPPGGLIIDPFAGSGSTGKAAVLEGFRFLGFELGQEYCDIANARIKDGLGIL